jgi:hypothetical protein
MRRGDLYRSSEISNVGSDLLKPFERMRSAAGAWPLAALPLGNDRGIGLPHFGRAWLVSRRFRCSGPPPWEDDIRLFSG